MAPRTVYRLRYALRLCASVFVLSTPCGGHPREAHAVGIIVEATPVATGCETPPSPRPTFANASHRPC
jgi:hypothetical protein